MKKWRTIDWLAVIGVGFYSLHKLNRTRRFQDRADSSARLAGMTREEAERLYEQRVVQQEKAEEALRTYVAKTTESQTKKVDPKFNASEAVNSLLANEEVDKHFPPKLKEKIYTKVISRQYAEKRKLTYPEIMKIVKDEWRDYPDHWSGTELLGLPGTPFGGDSGIMTDYPGLMD